MTRKRRILLAGVLRKSRYPKVDASCSSSRAVAILRERKQVSAELELVERKGDLLGHLADDKLVLKVSICVVLGKDGVSLLLAALRCEPTRTLRAVRRQGRSIRELHGSSVVQPRVGVGSVAAQSAQDLDLHPVKRERLNKTGEALQQGRDTPRPISLDIGAAKGTPSGDDGSDPWWKISEEGQEERSAKSSAQSRRFSAEHWQ